MSFESEMLLGRFRGRGFRLLLPTLMLALATFLLSFFWGRFSVDWQNILLYVVAGLIALLGFIAPVLRYLTTWTDVTTARVVARSGIWGQRYRSISLADVTSVEQGAGVITLNISGEEPMELRGLPKPRVIAQELSNLVAKSAANKS